MTPAEQYRKSAAEFRARAQSEERPSLKAEWESVAHRYRLLANRADDLPRRLLHAAIRLDVI